MSLKIEIDGRGLEEEVNKLTEIERELLAIQCNGDFNKLIEAFVVDENEERILVGLRLKK